MYVTDALGFMNYCYVGKVLDDGDIDLLGEPTERHKTYEEV